MATWYETLFDDRYLLFYEELLRANGTEAEVEFIDRALALGPSSRVLDLGCGFGRHSVPLASLGHQVTGVDLSEAMLNAAKALQRVAGVDVRWERRDMRDFSGLGSFDACVCLYTVLGYFSDAENAKVVQAIHDALVPGGRILLDLTNPLALMRGWPGVTWRETSRGVRRESSNYDALKATLKTERTLFGADGKRVDLPPSTVRMYAPHEVAQMIRSAGFEIEQVYGALRDDPFRWNQSVKQVWIARRP